MYANFSIITSVKLELQIIWGGGGVTSQTLWIPRFHVALDLKIDIFDFRNAEHMLKDPCVFAEHNLKFLMPMLSISICSL